MLRDLRNSKGSTEVSAMSMWILVSVDNHNILNLVLSLNVRVLETSYEIQQAQYFIAPPADTSCCSNHNLKACHITS